MSKPALRKRVFNLLKPEKAPQSAWDKIYDWLVVRARITILVCEVIILIAFVAKVAVDIQTKDLNEALEAKSQVLAEFFGTVEGELRDIQQRSRVYQNVWEFSNSYAAILREINSYIANPGVEVVVALSGSNLTIRGDDNLQALQTIEAKMKSSPSFTDVKLELNTEGNQTSGTQGKYVISAKIVKVTQREKLVVKQANQDAQSNTN